MSVEELEREAMKLPADERERLAVRLLSSVDRGLAFESDWAEETHRRVQQVREQRVDSVPGDDVFGEATDRLK